MKGSLRLQLFTLVGGVILLSLFLVAILGRMNLKGTFREYLKLENTERLAAAMAETRNDLEGLYKQDGHWQDIAETLEPLHARHRFAILLFDPDGQIQHAFPEDLLKREPYLDEGIVFINGSGERQHRKKRIVGTQVTLRNTQNQLIGTAALMPDMNDERRLREVVFLRKTNKRQWLAIFIAGFVALIVAERLSRRLIRPLEALTQAVGDLADGKLSQRVDDPGNGEIGKLSRSFNHMASELERQEELRRNMANDVAHEIRRPLTNMRCQLEAMRDGLQEADAPSIESLYEETIALNHLVDDLRDLSLIEAGQLRLRMETGEIYQLLQGIADRFEPIATQAELTFHTEISASIKAWVDPQRLRQVIENLLRNALTHTPPQGQVGLVAGADKQGVVIEITDNGQGIAADKLPHVFERFYRAEDGRDSRSGGTGLGLTICRELVTAMDGQIHMESGLNQGTRVVVQLRNCGPA